MVKAYIPKNIDFEYHFVRDGIDVIRPGRSYDTYIDRVEKVVIHLGQLHYGILVKMSNYYLVFFFYLFFFI